MCCFSLRWNVDIICIIEVYDHDYYVMYLMYMRRLYLFFFFQAEDGIRDLVRSRGLGDVYKRQVYILGNELTHRDICQYEEYNK